MLANSGYVDPERIEADIAADGDKLTAGDVIRQVHALADDQPVLVGGQLGWALRPYLVRPRAPEVPFVRAVEGSLFDAIATSLRSAQGLPW